MAGTITEFVQVVGVCDVEDIDLTQGNFTEIAVPETLEIPEQKPDIEQVLKVMIEGNITKTRLIATPEGSASSGMGKTGQGLVVEGRLHQKVVYVAETEAGDQPVHSAEYNFPFSTFLAINTCVEPCQAAEIDVEICIEDVYVEMLSPREIFKNVTILVNAIVPNTPPCIDILEPASAATIEEAQLVDPLGGLPVKIRAIDCECLDRVEVDVFDVSSPTAPIFEFTEYAMGENDFQFDVSFSVAAASTPYTVTATAFDCAEKSATVSITFAVI